MSRRAYSARALHTAGGKKQSTREAARPGRLRLWLSDDDRRIVVDGFFALIDEVSVRWRRSDSNLKFLVSLPDLRNIARRGHGHVIRIR